MAYNQNIPQPTDQLSQSQADILANFQAINPFFLGIFDIPASAANPAVSGNNIIFAKNYTETGNDEVYIQNESASINYPITASQNITVGPEIKSWAFLPSGILLKWGTTAVGGIGAVIPVTQGPNFVAGPITVLVSCQTFGSQVVAYNATTAGFTADGTLPSTPFSYLMIGLGQGD